MKKLFSIVLIGWLFASTVTAQMSDDFRKEFDDFLRQTETDFCDFRQKANMEYADFLSRAWKEFEVLPAIEKPKEKTIPPIEARPEEKDKPIDDIPVIIKDLIKLPSPEPQPLPISPIKPVKNDIPIVRIDPQPATEPQPQTLTVCLYGTDMSVRMAKDLHFSVKANEKDVARVWKYLSAHVSDNTIYDCLQLRCRHGLSDWAYLRLLDAIGDKLLGKDTGEAEILKAYLFCQSGYRMRLAFADDSLVMLYGTRYLIYGKLGWDCDGMRYYCDRKKVDRIFICQASFPGEKPMSVAITTQQRFAGNLSAPRIITARDGMSINSEVNPNDIAFCDDFPSSQYGDNPITRWAIYANAPASLAISDKLYPQLRTAIEGLSDYDAVNRLCRWIQTGFVYEYDDKVWGGDRAFFADETLYYPYCDCEDRSILLTRIVRDLLDLPCALVYYPGHLATAVCLGEDVKGDYLRIDGKKFLICDPTYINAPIGRTMPGMQNDTAKAILLD